MYDALGDPAQARELFRRIATPVRRPRPPTAASFSTRPTCCASRPTTPTVRPIGVEQSNSSLVFDEEMVIKVFRKLEPGVNPELEMLRLPDRARVRTSRRCTAGRVRRALALARRWGWRRRSSPTARGGWELALEEMGSKPEGCSRGSRGWAASRRSIHTVLASDAGDPAFSPEEPSQEALSLPTRPSTRTSRGIFPRLPEDEALARGGAGVRERLAARAQLGISGRVIRTPRRLHLGQTLLHACAAG